MKKKKSVSVQKNEGSQTNPREEFRNILASQIKRIYRSKSKTINFKDSDKAFLLVAFKRALSYDWHKEDIREFEKREGDARRAVDEAKDIRKGLEEAAKIMGWIKENKEGGKKTRIKNTKLTPAEEIELIRAFKSLQMFKPIPKKGEDGDEFKKWKILTRKEAIKHLYKVYQWHSKGAFEKHIRRLLNKHAKNHENTPPHEDQLLEDMLMEISELEKRLDT
jgi:hypothetical protein